ncbi:hypothetical protein R3P38DRAFT_3190073 [Favolaschia claudopus]|uniref:Cytochrome P450 n=1 Tax=Favolaschia claudopus TaxID=2862362 RepID=A0AAW0BQR7_9AGAR
MPTGSQGPTKTSPYGARHSSSRCTAPSPPAATQPRAPLQPFLQIHVAVALFLLPFRPPATQLSASAQNLPHVSASTKSIPVGGRRLKINATSSEALGRASALPRSSQTLEGFVGAIVDTAFHVGVVHVDDGERLEVVDHGGHTSVTSLPVIPIAGALSSIQPPPTNYRIHGGCCGLQLKTRVVTSSEIYPDFLRNYERLLNKHGHMVHASYLGKSESAYLTDDPELLIKGDSVNAFFWGFRAAGQTIGEVAVGMDLKMLDSADSQIANIFKLIGGTLSIAQTLFRKGSVYRALRNPERRQQKIIEVQVISFLDTQSERILHESQRDMPIDEAVVSTSSLGFYLTFCSSSKRCSGCIILLFNLHARRTKVWALTQLKSVKGFLIIPCELDLITPGGYLVPKGRQVTVALHSVMINPERKDPLTFDSERWGTEKVRKRHKYAYIPFAAGGRGCIGFNFGLQEIKGCPLTRRAQFPNRELHGRRIPGFRVYSLHLHLRLMLKRVVHLLQPKKMDANPAGLGGNRISAATAPHGGADA